MNTTPQGPQQQTAPTKDRETPFRAQPWQEQVGRICALGAAIALECIPVTAWLFVVAAANQAPRSTSLPFWWIVIVVLAAWGIAATLRRIPQDSQWTRRAEAALRALMIVGWIVTVVLSLLVSPIAYRGTPLTQLLVVVSSDLSTGAGRLGSDAGLALLVAYLWWRGLLLGRLPLARERLYTRFLIGLAALMLAIASAASLRGAARAIADAIFAVLLPSEVFVGLVGIALAHLADTASEQRERRHRAVGDELGLAPTDTRAWLVAALGISGSIVGGALALALLVSYDSVRAVTQLLGPVADALGAVIFWLIEAFAYLLFLLLNEPITWAYTHLRTQSAKSPATAPSSQLPGQGHSAATLPHEWLVAGRYAVIALGVALVAFALILVLRRFHAWRRPQAFEEERETLSARDVLGGQLRSLLAALRRSHPAESETEEPLAMGSIRYRYREVLRAATATPLGRRANETPNEYARRLQASVRDLRPGAVSPDDAARVAAALETVTNAYDVARYGDDDHQRVSASSVEQTDLTDAQHTLLIWLRAQASGQEHPRAADAQRRSWWRSGHRSE